MRRPKAEVAPYTAATVVAAGSTTRVALTVKLPDGLHVQSDAPRDPSLIPTVLTVEAPAGVTVRHLIYPKPTDFEQAGQPQPLAVFEHEFVDRRGTGHRRRRQARRSGHPGPASLPGVRRQAVLRPADGHVRMEGPHRASGHRGQRQRARRRVRAAVAWAHDAAERRADDTIDRLEPGDGRGAAAAATPTCCARSIASRCRARPVATCLPTTSCSSCVMPRRAWRRRACSTDVGRSRSSSSC